MTATPEDEVPSSSLSTDATSRHSHAGQQDVLSRGAKLTFCAAAVLGISGCTYASGSAVLWLPIILAPSATALHYRSRLPASQRGDITTVVWTFLFTGTVSSIAVMAVQLVLGLALSYAIFGEDTKWLLVEFQTVTREDLIRDEAHRLARTAFVARPAYWVWMVMGNFLVAGLCEEAQKYCSLMVAKKLRPRNKQGQIGNWEWIVYGITTGLAFATMENVAFVMGSAGESWRKMATTLAERSILGTSAHTLCGVSTAIGVAKLRRGGVGGMLSAVGRAAFFHGLTNLSLLSVSALRGHIGWVHPEDWQGVLTCFALAAAGQGILGWLVRNDLKKMKLESAEGKIRQE